jgi:bifunctional UDP-N-acetylglucosamine pyrophosphorylase/glucosamine-1-phosphate N-acetyltransferase
MTSPLVLVLAGGAANRFWPLRDKQLVEFGSQSLLERHLGALQRLGCERFVVVVRPDLADDVRAAVASLPADIRVAVQKSPRGMADAVLAGVDALSAYGDGPLYVTQAHDVVEQRLHAAMLDTWSREGQGMAGLIAAQRVSNYFPGGYLVLQGDRVANVIEKPGAGQEPSDLVNLVAHVFASWRSLIEAIEMGGGMAGADDAYERALSRLMRQNTFRAQVYEGRWQALKYSWHMLDVMDMLLDLWSRGLESPGPDYEQREGGVFIGQDVRIYPGAYVVGPSLIGHGSVIGHNALVRGSIVGPRCVVGFGSEVARSYLAEGVELHHNYVGDSVMDRETSMGYGATTANYRLDGRSVPSMVGGQRVDSERMKLGMVLGAGSKLGVNTSTMPGVKIGAGTIVGPMLKVVRDVPDGERVLDEEKYGRF